MQMKKSQAVAKVKLWSYKLVLPVINYSVMIKLNCDLYAMCVESTLVLLSFHLNQTLSPHFR